MKSKPLNRLLKPLLYFATHPAALMAQDREIETSGGIKFLHRSENQIERTIKQTGEWEPWETAVVRTIVHTGAVSFDIGANIGYFSLLMSDLSGPTGEVHCFEPTTYGFNRMLQNIALNGHLPIENLRLNKKGILSAETLREEALEARFSQRVAANTEAERIAFTTVDKYVEQHNIETVDFIKIDIDGHDMEAMKGASQTLTEKRPLVLAEFNSVALKQHGASVAEYADIFMTANYDRFLLDGREAPEPIASITNPRLYTKTRNFVIIPRGIRYPPERQ